jgi:hypothetical protein
MMLVWLIHRPYFFIKPCSNQMDMKTPKIACFLVLGWFHNGIKKRLTENQILNHVERFIKPFQQ